MMSENRLDLPALRFEWLQEELPAGPWSPALRDSLTNGMKSLGREAIEAGEFPRLEQLYTEFATLLSRLWIDRDDVDRAADLYMLLHGMMWRRTQPLEQLKPFNTDVVLPFTHFLDRIYPKFPRRFAMRDVPRIGYLSETYDLFGSNAVARTTVSLMLGQHEIRDKADWPILFCMNKPGEEVQGFAEQHGLNVRDLARATPSQTVEAVLEQLRLDDIDILISDTNCAIATMVLQRRPVPVQVMHENGFAPWAIPELDLALMGITKPSSGLFDRRTEMVQTPRNTAFVFQKQPRPQAVIDAVKGVLRTESGVDRPSTVYGFYGRMAKITEDYMAQVEAILLREPTAIFFAGGTGRISPIKAYLGRSPVADRMVIYNDFIDAHLIAECIDVFLDSFPFPGGMSCIEVQARGVPVVWTAPPADKEMSIIGEQRDVALCARDAAAYVDMAVKLADPVARAHHGALAHAIAQQFGDMRAQAEIVETHLRATLDKARDVAKLAA